MLPGLLRDLVITTARLVGRSWLDANAEETASFTRLQTSSHAPPLPELDYLLGCLLRDRFSLPTSHRQLGPAFARRRSAPPAATYTGRPVHQGRSWQPAELREPSPRTDRDAGNLSAAGSVNGLGPDESRTGTAGCASDPATAATVPTWIWLVRMVNLEMQRELPSSGRRGSTN
jgi:hypothetical protein